MNIKYFLLSLMLIISGLIIPQAQANSNNSNGTGTSAEHCTTYSISKIIAVINAGTVEVCLVFPVLVSYGSQFRIVGRIAGPDNALGVAFVQTWSIVTNSMVGCNLAPGTSLTQASFNNAATSGSDAYAILTMDDDHCSGVLSYTLTVASIQIVSWHGIFNVFSDISSVDNGDCAQAQISGSVFFDATTNSANTIRECVSYPEVISAQEGSTQNFYFTINTVLPRVAGTGYVLSTVDNGGCASTGCASFTTSDCGSSSPILVSHKNSLVGGSPPPTNNFISETYKMAYTNAQNCDVSIIKGIDIKLSGVSIILNFPLLSFSPHPLAQGLQQNQLSGTINVVNSGTQHIIVDSWPSLTAAVTNSGTVSIQNTAGQTFAISGTVNTPITGSLSVTNSGGQTVSISSWPQLQAVLSGRLDNFMFVCGATGATPASYNSATQNCNQLTLSAILSGTVTQAGTINVVNSGGQTVSISSWPSLTAALSGNVGITFNNALTIHQDALSGTINVVNSGGQSVVVTSWPQLQAVLSGGINVHQDQACGATIVCKSQNNETVMAIVTGNTTVNQNNNLNVQLSLIPYYILLIAVAFFAVFADWKGDALYWFIDLILSIYLLIIRPENSVIPRAIFLGWVFIVAYQAVALLSNKKAKNLSGDE